MLRFTVESMEKCQTEIDLLVHKHWEEVEYYAEHLPSEPDYKVYLALEEAGILKVLTARRDDGLMVGYVTLLRNFHLHSRNKMLTVADAVYLHPNYRHGRNAYRFIEYIIDYLRSSDTDLATINVPADHPLGRICEKLGMQLHEQVYSLYLGD